MHVHDSVWALVHVYPSLCWEPDDGWRKSLHSTIVPFTHTVLKWRHCNQCLWTIPQQSCRLFGCLSNFCILMLLSASSDKLWELTSVFVSFSGNWNNQEIQFVYFYLSLRIIVTACYVVFPQFLVRVEENIVVPMTWSSIYLLLMKPWGFANAYKTHLTGCGLRSLMSRSASKPFTNDFLCSSKNVELPLLKKLNKTANTHPHKK